MRNSVAERMLVMWSAIPFVVLVQEKYTTKVLPLVPSTEGSFVSELLLSLAHALNGNKQNMAHKMLIILCFINIHIYKNLVVANFTNNGCKQLIRPVDGRLLDTCFWFVPSMTCQ